MNRMTKKIVTALIGLGAVSTAIHDVQACPGGGRGYGGSYGGYRPAPVCTQPRYVQPAPQPYYQQPAYPPGYEQPALGGYANPAIGQPNPQLIAGQNPSASPNQLPPTVQKMANVRPTGAPRPQQAPAGQLAPQQQPQRLAQPALRTGGQQQQQFATQPTGRPQQTVAPSQRVAAQGQPSAGSNPLLALGSQPVASQPQQAPARQVVQRPQSQPSQSIQRAQPESQGTSPMNQAQISALQALASFEGDEPQQLDAPAEQPEQAEAESFEEAQPVQVARNTGRPAGQPMHIGQWSASLQNGSKVQLTLQPNGSFTWVATSGEKVSSFEGSYTVSNGSLTLVRSSDNQKLIGSITPSGSSSFTFKLTGAKDAGLNFSRS